MLSFSFWFHEHHGKTDQFEASVTLIVPSHLVSHLGQLSLYEDTVLIFSF